MYSYKNHFIAVAHQAIDKTRLMLKLTYTDNDFYIERLSESLEDWLNIRILLCLRAAKSIYIKPSAASFLVVADLPKWSDLIVLQAEHCEQMEFNLCDAEYMEVRLQGIWVTSEKQTHEGTFVCTLSKKAEIMLNQLWRVCI